MKKGQVTVFVILGLIIVFGVLLYFFVRGHGFIGFGSDASLDEVNMFIENCVEHATHDAVYEIALQGGYLTLPNDSLNGNIPYYYDSHVLVPSKETVESELGEFATKSLFFCTHSFSDFDDFEVSAKNPKVEVEIFDDRVHFDVFYPVVVYKNNRSYYFDSFEEDVFTRFGLIFDLACKIAFLYEEYEAFCFSCIYDVISEEDLYVDIYDYEGSSVFLISDLSDDLNGRPLEFYFVVREW